MGEETEQIAVAETSTGLGGSRPAGETVSLPVVELLTGRGFVTGKSGSGKSNSASVVAEQLLDSGFGLFIVDIDGEYYGLKEEYEILHAGADEECDIQVTTDHAERLAVLALEQNVPIILDVSSYLDESEAEAMLTAVARSLFAKGKKQKQPFLLLVEEIHEYIPEQGSVGECGRTLIKIGKRGRKHGLGLCGISQRPADVKKEFITQCDWLLWHRLTWQNDTRVVRRILDGEYADAVEHLDDGEGFLVTDWTDDVRRVQFYRKQTFDAGATPGLEDVERPDLKSVSEDLVSELAEITDAASAREDRIAELESTLEQRETRIEELERELRDARDLQDLAEQFVAALTGHTTGEPGNAGGTAVSDRSGQQTDRERETTTGADDEAVTAAVDGDASAIASLSGSATGPDTDTDEDPVSGERFSADRILSRLDEAPGPGGDDSTGHTVHEKVELELYSDAETAGGDRRATDPNPRAADGGAASVDPDGTDEGTDSGVAVAARMPEEEPLAVRELKAEVGGLSTETRQMLTFYREEGPASAQNAHFAAGGDGSRTRAYARNRTLRTRGLIGHVGRGQYDYRLRERLGGELGDHVDGDVVDSYATEIERTVLGVDP